MGKLVHTCLGSSSLISHVLHCPPLPPARSFETGPAVINTHWVGSRSPLGWWLGLHQPPWSFGFPNERNQGKQGDTLCLSTGFLTGPRTAASMQQDERRTSPQLPPPGGCPAPPHRPLIRRDLRHAHANAHARIRHRLHLRTPTVVVGPRSAISGPQVATQPTEQGVKTRASKV